MAATILVTGGDGLIGRALTRWFKSHGREAISLDTTSEDPAHRIDVRDGEALSAFLAAPENEGISGIIHLAAVSRVIDGERDPQLCRSVNLGGTGALLEAALGARRRPWLIHASSREVYGQQDTFPVPETAPYRPRNVYARTKVEAEHMVEAARERGLQAATVRFSSVYGDILDHADRVTPAFAAAASRGGELSVEGSNSAFDLTHADDVADGVMRVAAALDTGAHDLPPIHFASGSGITLLDLAQLACDLAGESATIVEAAPRAYGVNRFVGDPRRAEELLGWRASTPLAEGLGRLIADYRKAAGARSVSQTSRNED